MTTNLPWKSRALAPALSNLQVLRIAGSFRPLERFWQLKQLQAGADGYFYWKHRRLGGIYDVDAADDARTIGQVFNANLYWCVISDVIVSARFGIFFPGNAYPPEANDSEIYVSTVLTFSI